VRRPIAPTTLPLPQATPAAEPAPRVLPTPEPKTIDSPEPVNPTRTPDKIRRPAPKIVHQEASPNLSSSRPAPVPRAEKRQRGNDRADLTLPARWWNIPFALASVVACAVLVGGLGVETIRVHRSQAILAKTLANPQATPDAIVAAARSMESSPLARWDAYREHLLAQATLLACERSPGLASADRQTQRDNARHLFKRAAERSPGSPYHQLNRALLASETDANERWNRIEQIPRPDGVIQEQIALRQIRVGQTAKGIDQLRSLLAKEPASAGRIVQSLLAAGVGTAVAMEMVPDAPPAWLDLAMLLKREAVIGLRREIEERLDQVDARSASDPSIVTSAVKAAEWGEVEIQLERWDRAARWAERAIEQDPTNPRWKLILADTLAHQDRFEEANRLLAELPVKLAPTESAQRQALLQRMTGNRSEAIPVSAAQAN
jgi:tetratricopeptide (TPR) repeat protein